MAMHTPWNQDDNQSYILRSNQVYTTHINRGLGRTQIAKGEYCNVVTDHCVDHKTFENISSIFRVYNLDQQAF